jgi:hypothetical protein
LSQASLKTLLDNSLADLRPFKKALALNLLNLIISKSSLHNDSNFKPMIEDVKNGIDANLEILRSNKPSVINEFVRLIHQMWSFLAQEVSQFVFVFINYSIVAPLLYHFFRQKTKLANCVTKCPPKFEKPYQSKVEVILGKL